MQSPWQAAKLGYGQFNPFLTSWLEHSLHLESFSQIYRPLPPVIGPLIGAGAIGLAPGIEGFIGFGPIGLPPGEAGPLIGAGGVGVALGPPTEVLGPVITDVGGQFSRIGPSTQLCRHCAVLL